MIKFVFLITVFFTLSLYLYAESDPANHTESDNTEFIELMFGVLPNPDGKINNFANVKINYSENLSSSFMIYLREYAKVKKGTTSDGDDTEDINSTKRRDLKLNTIHYNFKLIDNNSINFSFAPELNINYYDEEKTDEFNSTWDSDTDPGKKDLYFERIRINTRSLMPIVEAAFNLKLYDNFSFYLGCGFLPVSFDKTEYDEFGTSTEEDPVLQREAYYEAQYNVNYTSMGYSAKAGLSVNNILYGSLIIDFYYIYKQGNSEIEDTWWDNDLQENISEKYTVVDKRTTINIDVYYQMKFLEFRGILPVLKFGFLRQTVMLDDEEEPLLTYNNYDFGFALKF